ncbi:MAG: tetratricopeptide repeat protein [Spirulina sp. SIO3F2]|nr:tetratricopeptide repeat protein [Spirulina sp. SIO3F2]
MHQSSTTPNDWEILQRIGAHYDGHPLVLQVIAEEIRQSPFRGDIARYWQHYEAEFSSAAPTTANKLERSRLFRRRVRQRVEQAIQRLPESARQMLCACSVFRRPVPERFWLTMVGEGDAQVAFDTLQERGLVEYASAAGNTLLFRQHNLIRSVAFNLLKADVAAWDAAERQAAHLWLNDYEPEPDAPNLETVRGYLEAFDHYCEVEDWEQAAEIYMQNLYTSNQPLHWQLFIWGNYQELTQISERLAEKVSEMKIRCFLNLGNSNVCLGNFNQAVDWYEKASSAAQEIGDRQGEGAALGNLGNAYYSLGQYERALDYHQQYLTLAQKLGNRQGEGNALGGLGNAYYSLGQYERAINYHQQYLTIAREIGNRRGEGIALGNLGIVYKNLGQYERAINYHQQCLTIAREIGDRAGEGHALGGLGLAYNSLGQYEQTINFYQQHLTIAQDIGDRVGEGTALVNMGATLLKLKDYPESLTNNQAALKIVREIGFRGGEAEALKNLAEVHQALGEIETAKQYAQQALALATELGIPLKAECEALLAELEKDHKS